MGANYWIKEVYSRRAYLLLRISERWAVDREQRTITFVPIEEKPIPHHHAVNLATFRDIGKEEASPSEMFYSSDLIAYERSKRLERD